MDNREPLYRDFLRYLISYCEEKEVDYVRLADGEYAIGRALSYKDIAQLVTNWLDNQGPER